MANYPVALASREKLPDRRPRWGSEAALEEKLVTRLRELGIPCRRQLWCGFGWADVVTADTVYEVKVRLGASDLLHAFGQVTLYADALLKERRVIIGYPTKGTKELVKLIRERGVLVNQIT